MKKVDQEEKGINELLDRRVGNVSVKRIRKTNDFIEQEFNLDNVSCKLK
jgi:hypothetical protein